MTSLTAFWITCVIHSLGCSGVVLLGVPGIQHKEFWAFICIEMCSKFAGFSSLHTASGLARKIIWPLHWWLHHSTVILHVLMSDMGVKVLILWKLRGKIMLLCTCAHTLEMYWIDLYMELMVSSIVSMQINMIGLWLHKLLQNVPEGCWVTEALWACWHCSCLPLTSLTRKLQEFLEWRSDVTKKFSFQPLFANSGEK